jgi:hypothetical protein
MNIKDSLIRNDKSPKFYQYYPKLFSAYFDDVSEDKINKLSEGKRPTNPYCLWCLKGFTL